MPDDFGQIMQTIAARAIKQRRPLAAQIELTRKCHLDCRHCFLDRRPADEELSADEVVDLLEQLAELGVLMLSFTGGEIFLRHDWEYILASARENRFASRILTTGHHIDADIANRLYDLAVSGVEISIYSIRPEIHDAITGKTGSLDKSLRAVRLLRDNGVNVIFKTPVMTLNVEHVSEVVLMARSMHCTCLIDPQIIPAEHDVRDPQEFALDRDTLAEFLDKDDIREVLFGLDQGLCQVFEMRDIKPDDRICNIAEQELHIDAYGNVAPCMLYPALGNIRESELADIWWNHPEMKALRNIQWADMLKCPSCSERRFCSPCIAMSVMEGRDALDCNSVSGHLASAICDVYEKRNRRLSGE